jgi:hypothetical protein
MARAFQADAFQNDAFQTDAVVGPTLDAFQAGAFQFPGFQTSAGTVVPTVSDSRWQFPRVRTGTFVPWWTRHVMKSPMRH